MVPPLPPGKPPLPPAPAQPKRVVRTLYSFAGDHPEHLPIEDGEILELIDADDADWWKVRRSRDGRTGIVPATYVEELQGTDYQVRFGCVLSMMLQSSYECSAVYKLSAL